MGLPSMMPYGLDRGFFLDWVRLAEEAGFHSLGTLDRPNSDSWDVLTVLAGAATVTERVRLAIAVLVLSTHNEVEVARKVARPQNPVTGPRDRRSTAWPAGHVIIGMHHTILVAGPRA